MIEFNPTCLSNIVDASFPLNHDCILKVNYIPGSGLRFQYFTCRSQDSGSLSVILSSLALVAKVECIPVDKFNDTI